MTKKRKINNKKREEIKDLNSLLDAVYNSGYCLYWDFGKFLIQVIKRVQEEKDYFEKSIEEKRRELEETPLTRKQFEEKIEELESEPNIFESSDMFNYKHELFYKLVLAYFVSKKVEDKEKSEEIFDFIWKKLDFMSLLFFFRNHSYSYSDEYENSYDENGDFSPCSSNHIYNSGNIYAYQSNLVDEIINLMK